VVLAAVTVTAVVAGAGLAASRLLGSSDASSDLDRLELRISDLPAGYSEALRVKPAAGCAAAVDRVALRRLRARGLASCALVKFRRQERTDDPRSLVYLLEYLFADAPRASAGLAQIRRDSLARATDPDVVIEDLPTPTLGDEAPRAMRFALRHAGMTYGSGFTYWWRRNKVVAVLAVSSILLHDFDRQHALGLARRIDERATS
jgi:hypothetical protein